VEEYIELVIDAIMGRGARPAIQAFQAGFSTVFPVTDLRTFSAEELVMMFGNADEDWSTESEGFVFFFPSSQGFYLTFVHSTGRSHQG